MWNQGLATIFRLNGVAFGANTAGISAAESLASPLSGGNCMNWMVGHLLASRNEIHRLLGLPLAWESPLVSRYARGSAPLRTGEAAVEFTALLEAHARSQAVLTSALESVPPETLARELDPPGPLGMTTVGARVAGLGFHEAYHVGQLGLLRRSLGHEGALR